MFLWVYDTHFELFRENFNNLQFGKFAKCSAFLVFNLATLNIHPSSSCAYYEKTAHLSQNTFNLMPCTSNATSIQ